MQELRGIRIIAPVQLPRFYMEVSGLRHAPAALYPSRKKPLYPFYRRLDGPQRWSGRRG
jgi:hypothetical protein